MRANSRQGPLEGQRLSERAYQSIKARLLEGEWSAHDSIAVEALRTELGVSKQPVMDALRRLSVEGLVEIIPQVGSRVPAYTQDEASDFFTMFASLEAEATAVATRRYAEDQLAELIRINDELGQVAVIDDPGGRVHGYRTLNRAFHGLLLEMTHSSVILRVSEQMWDMSDLIINTSGRRRPLAHEVGERHADHERIIDALKSRDVRQARKEMRQHILRNIPMLEHARSED
ncbi:GntR family transcriptional regulator [Amycolatopsis pigmentata]|uniref:GntR family transcriptional regulator n=1 Tax=Amycolatopsis pigmentata TaxID=450801 RepID=A0ABW5FN82_9PSEU